jgi:hypothetical protein
MAKRKNATYFYASEELRAVLCEAGSELSAAARALIVVGAYHAGMDVSGLRREFHAALAADLAPNVRDHITQVARRIDEGRPPPREITLGPPASPREPPRAPVRPEDDPLSDVGIDVDE